MKRLIFFVAITVAFSHWSNARQADLASYFPLDEGNSWTFIEVLEPPFSPPDTLWYGPFSIGSTEIVNDTTYYSFDQFPILATFFRSDGSGKIWGRVDGRDQLVFDFSVVDGDSYTLSLGRESWEQYTVRVEAGSEVSVSAGAFSDVVDVKILPPDGVLDGSFHLSFASGVGLIQYAYGVGSNGSLHTAIVDGTRITEVESATYPVEAPTEILPFPNPFTNSTSFVATVPAGEMPEVRVHDLIGRVVSRLAPVSCTSTECEFVWRAENLSTGVYLISVMSETGGRQSAAVVKQ